MLSVARHIDPIKVRTRLTLSEAHTYANAADIAKNVTIKQTRAPGNTYRSMRSMAVPSSNRSLTQL